MADEGVPLVVGLHIPQTQGATIVELLIGMESKEND